MGSIFKVVTAVAGLEERKILAGELLPCRGWFLENSAHFRCWIWNRLQGMHGEITLRQALERSCNNYFYEAGRRCGMEGVARWACAMGLGAPTGIDLPGEAGGVVPRRSQWPNDILSLSIGQHELMATPLQAAVMMAAVANGGRIVTPHLRRGAADPPRPVGISPATVEELRNGLRDVVHGQNGTAHHSSLGDFGAAGKTSSAQTREGRSSHAWFAGYAPHDAPRHVVVVLVEHGGAGGAAAAPAAARLFEILKNAPPP
jgi:penicillin-binding protein 2